MTSAASDPSSGASEASAASAVVSSAPSARVCPSCGSTDVIIHAAGSARCSKCAAGFVSLEKATRALGLKATNFARHEGTEAAEARKSCPTCPGDLVAVDAPGERVLVCVACHGLWCSEAFSRRILAGDAPAPSSARATKREVTNPRATAPKAREVTNPRARMEASSARPPDDGRRTARWVLLVAVSLLAAVTTIALLRRAPATDIGGGATAAFPSPPRVDELTVVNFPAQKHELVVDGVQLSALHIVGAGDSDPTAIRRLIDETLGGRAVHEPLRSSLTGELIGSAMLTTDKGTARARAYVGQDVWILVVRGPVGLDDAVSESFLFSLRPPASRPTP